MANIWKGTQGLIGNTPLVELVNIEKELGLKAAVLAKLEYLNPAGSVKDRAAKAMIEDAEKAGTSERGGGYNRTHLGKYGNRTGFHCRLQRIQADPDHAGDHERGAQKYPESLRSPDRSHRRSKRDGRRH